MLTYLCYDSFVGRPTERGIGIVNNAEWKDFLSEQFGISKTSADRRRLMHYKAESGGEQDG